MTFFLAKGNPRSRTAAKIHDRTASFLTLHQGSRKQLDQCEGEQEEAPRGSCSCSRRIHYRPHSDIVSNNNISSNGGYHEENGPSQSVEIIDYAI